MWTRFKQWLAPPKFEGDADKTRVASLLNTILLAVFIITSLLTVLTALLPDVNPLSLTVGAVMALLSLAMLFVMRRGYIRFASIVLVTALWANVTFAVYLTGTIRAPLTSIYILCVIIAGLLLSNIFVVAFTGLSLLALFVLLQLEIAGMLPDPAEASSIGNWLVYAASFIMSAVLLQMAIYSIQDALNRARRYAADLEVQQAQLVAQSGNLTEALDKLEQRTRYLEATARVSREATAALEDPQRLLGQVVDLISEQFGYYHVGVFLINPTGAWAELQAASSIGGQQMMADAYQVEVGSQSMVGDVIHRGDLQISHNVGEDDEFLQNPYLPETHSALVLPLRARGEIIGALDVQSREAQIFSDEDVTALQSLADQVAVAINNANLFAQLEESLEAEQRAYGQVTREAWRELARAQSGLNVLSQEHGITPVQTWWPEMYDAFEHGQIVQADEDESALAVPITVRGQVVGVLDGRKPGGTAWTQEEIALLQSLTEQVGVALDSARLYQNTQRRAARDRTISQVGARIRESLEMDTMLRTAAAEMRQALNLGDLVIRLAPGDQEEE